MAAAARSRLAWFSPLPPLTSGISDYTSEIVPYLVGRVAVDVFCPRPGPFKPPRAPRGARVLRPARYFAHPDAYDACLYHLGNNPDHEFVYTAARRRPGIVVLHDTVLHHLIAHATVERGWDPVGYERVLEEEYGERGGPLATLRERRVATDLEKFLFPLVSHVVAEARGVVVHSHDAAARIASAAPGVPVAVIPHHAGDPPLSVAAIDRSVARRAIGVSPETLVVGHLGFITRPKQPAAILEGFARLHREVPDSLLLMVGADRTAGALPRLVARLGIGDAVRLTGYVNLDRMYLYLRAIDVAINLRYPSAGETSGTLARSLAEGRPVIVNNYASWAELPPDLALKVEIDRPQAEQVADHLLRLAKDPELRKTMGERARLYARDHLDPVRCVDSYLAFARRVNEGAIREV
jgi:glycosyltransferase involved in cell wall biosynthesis